METQDKKTARVQEVLDVLNMNRKIVDEQLFELNVLVKRNERQHDEKVN